MRYNSSGFFEEKVSLLGIGSADLPKNENGEPDSDKIAEIFKTSFEKDISFFFVSSSSGESEKKLFGENLSKKSRVDYFLCGTADINSLSVSSEKDIAELFRKQLAELKSGYFDYYVIDGITDGNFGFFEKSGIYSIFDKFKKSGLVRHLGFSVSAGEEKTDVLFEKYKWDFIKLDINFYSWDFFGADTLYRKARKKGIPFIASDPFMGGLILDPPEEVFEILRENDPLYSMQEWALRWFYDKKGLLCVITNPESAGDVSVYADTVSSSKTLNSSKKHSIKIAAQKLHEEKCEGETEE